MAVNVEHLPKSGKLIFEKSSFRSPKSRHSQVVADHHFNYLVNITLPCHENIPDSIAEAINDRNFIVYKIEGVKLSMLIERDFLEAFCKRGQLYLLSHGTKIDVHDTIALLPTGQLILHLSKDTYEQLGLEGKPSEFSTRKTVKYVVTVDLTASHFIPGKKNYERVKWCFTDRLDLKFDFLTSWEPPDKEICPSSIKQYFESAGCLCSEMKLKKRKQLRRSFLVPVIHSEKYLNSTVACDYLEMFEWLGALPCKVDCAETLSNGFISTYTCPEPNQLLSKCISYVLSEFISPRTLQKILEELRPLVKSGNCPWASLTVHGYADSPVSWKMKEHGFQNRGDNLYTFMVFPNDVYWLYVATGNHDVYL